MMSENKTSASRGERLQKILSHAGIASRRKSEELIEQGRVTINGKIAVLGDRAISGEDSIKVDGRRLRAAPSHRYLLFNKPRGCLCTASDPQGRVTVLDLVPGGRQHGMHTVGRLDYNTEGLLLVTNDGDFSQRVAHPRYGCTKLYEVKVKGRPEEAGLKKLRKGILIEGRRTGPCRISAMAVSSSRPASNTWWKVSLSEGRTRQIREMFLRIGHPVQRLRRVGIGPLRDPKLPVGEVRDLKPGEVEALLAGSTKSGNTKSDSGGRPKQRRSRRAGR